MDKKLFKTFCKRFYNAKDRCNNSNNKRYHAYWWRWIKCLRNNIEEFKNDMRDSFVEHVNIYWINETTLDRIDNNWHYSKENCRWLTRHEQSKNRRECRQFYYDWKHFDTLRDLANYVWINEATIRCRLNKWRDIIKVIETEIRDNKIKLEYNWKSYKSLSELCNELWLSWSVVYNRIKKWYDIKDAILIPKKEHKHIIEYKWNKFNSLKELAKYYNIPYWSIKRRYYNWYRWDELIEWRTDKDINYLYYNKK